MQHLSNAEIARQLNVSKETVSRWYNQEGIKKEYEPYSIPRPSKEELILFIDKSLADIGRYFHVSTRTVKRWFDSFGIEKDGSVFVQNKFPGVDAILSAYHMSIPQMARQFGVCETTARRWKQKYRPENISTNIEE